MSIAIHTDRDKRIHVVFDDEGTTQPERYVAWFEGIQHVVIAEPGESPATVWQNVLERLADTRAVIRRGAWKGRAFYYATIYAGITPTEQQKAEHMRDWISFCLYQLADPIHNKDSNSRVKALILLSKLHRLTAPNKVVR